MRWSLRSPACAWVRWALEDACVAVVSDLALAAGVAVFVEPLVEADEALGLVVDPLARAEPFAAEPLRFALLFIEEPELLDVGFEALDDGVVLCDGLARSLLPGLELLAWANVAPLKASAENRTPAEIRCLPFWFMNFSFVAPGGIPDRTLKAQGPYPLARFTGRQSLPVRGNVLPQRPERLRFRFGRSVDASVDRSKLSRD
ncbi:MAG: hypothetical protein M9885_06730 [Burkholderiaceae bacterium]|nr:hypothetical protein [Burkholderiaceae bacterium]